MITKANNATILKFIDDFPELLVCLTGTGGWPLSYVICDDMTVPAAAGDPMFGEPGSSYISVWDETVQHTSHAGVHDLADNKQDFKILHNSIEEVKVWIDTIPTGNG